MKQYGVSESKRVSQAKFFENESIIQSSIQSSSSESNGNSRGRSGGGSSDWRTPRAVIKVKALCLLEPMIFGTTSVGVSCAHYNRMLPDMAMAVLANR